MRQRIIREGDGGRGRRKTGKGEGTEKRVHGLYGNIGPRNNPRARDREVGAAVGGGGELPPGKGGGQI
jgi:hypothetical protein